MRGKKELSTPRDSVTGCTGSLTLRSEAFQNIFSSRLLQRLKWSLSAHAFGGLGGGGFSGAMMSWLWPTVPSGLALAGQACFGSALEAAQYFSQHSI